MDSSLNPVTYGIIGVGLMGIEHIRNILAIPGTQITCIADDYPDSLTSCMKTLETESVQTAANVVVFDSARKLFSANLCQVALICTPNHTHHAVLKDAYTYGDDAMHILVEKPMCTTVADCYDVIEASQRRAGLTYVGLEYCYMPPITRVIADTRRGLIGAPRMATIREHRFPFLRKVRNWNRFSCNSGGTFVEKCCHFFDLFNRIMAPEVPCSVFASGAQDVNHLDEVYDGRPSDILDNGFVIVEYSGGRRACLDLCMFAEASHSQEELSIVGHKGKLEAFLPQLEVRTGIRGTHSLGDVQVEIVDDDRIKYRGHHFGSSYLEHLDVLAVVKAMRSGKEMSTATAGLHQGLISVAIGVAAHMSIEQKKAIRLEELVDKSDIQRAVQGILMQ